MRRAALSFATLAALALAGACARGDSTAGVGGSGTGGLDLSTSTGGNGVGGACALYEEEAVLKPLNLYLLVDKSSSMAGNKWSAATAGLAAFVDSPASEGLRVGLRFFPRAPDATPACDQNAYKEPEVPFAPLPNNAGAIKAALDAAAPDGFSTPMWPALGGGILQGISLAETQPGDVSAVLLVTDGKPEGPAASCSGVNPEDPAEVAKLAAIGYAFKPSIVTYVVGLPGVDQAAANLIAAAGGSEQAILVASTNVETEFQEALSKVRGDALPCRYDLPAQVVAGEVELGLVNVEVTPPDGDAITIPFDPSCAGPGWAYDDPVTPTAIVLCPSDFIT